MTKDKTVTMSRDLAEQILPELRAGSYEEQELRAVLAGPVVERQDGSALMKISADLANRHPLRQLYLVCEHQVRINTDSLHEHLDKCGDLLAGIALDIRRAITSLPAPVAVVLPERRVVNEGDSDADQNSDHGWNACLDKVKELNQ